MADSFEVYSRGGGAQTPADLPGALSGEVRDVGKGLPTYDYGVFGLSRSHRMKYRVAMVYLHFMEERGIVVCSR